MQLLEGNTIESVTEPIDGQGKIFVYKGSFIINDNELFTIQKGKFTYNITKEQLIEHMGTDKQEDYGHSTD